MANFRIGDKITSYLNNRNGDEATVISVEEDTIGFKVETGNPRYDGEFWAYTDDDRIERR